MSVVPRVTLTEPCKAFTLLHCIHSSQASLYPYAPDKGTDSEVTQLVKGEVRPACGQLTTVKPSTQPTRDSCICIHFWGFSCCCGGYNEKKQLQW